MTKLGVSIVGLLGVVVGVLIWEISLRRVAAGSDGEVTPENSRPAGALLLSQGSGSAARLVLFAVGVGGYYALSAERYGDDWSRLAATAVFSVPLFVTLLVDAWTRLIHTNVLLAGLFAGLVVAALAGFRPLLASGLAAIGAATVFGLFFLLARLIYRNVRLVPFGLGDVYLAAMIGAMVRGQAVIQALFFGIVLAAGAGVILLVTRRAGRHDPIPYGSFLCLGALMTLLLNG